MFVLAGRQTDAIFLEIESTKMVCIHEKLCVMLLLLHCSYNGLGIVLKFAIMCSGFYLLGELLEIYVSISFPEMSSMSPWINRDLKRPL